MDNIIDLIATDAPASEISDSIKSAIFAKASDRIDAMKHLVSTSIFGEQESTEDNE